VDVPFSDFLSLVEVAMDVPFSDFLSLVGVLLAFRVVLVIVPVGDFDFGYGY
jgi:hypothetical protein